MIEEFPAPTGSERGGNQFLPRQSERKDLSNTVLV